MSSTTYAGTVGAAVTIAADARCELCGAVLASHDTEVGEGWKAVEAMRMIADLWLWDSVACGIVLARMVHPDATYRQLGRMVGRDEKAVRNRMDRLEAEYPQVGYFVRSHGPHSMAQNRRKK